MVQVFPLVENSKLTEAISHLDTFLSQEVNTEVRSAALGFRAHISERVGNIEEAQNDLLTAHSLSGPSYQRYVHELGLGSLFERHGLNEEAHSWYRAALNTCLLDNETSGGSALKGLLRLRPAKNLPEEDIALCREVIKHSWRVLRLPGVPDLSDLEGSVSIIMERQGKPLPPK